jgi:hypothetical protein
MPANARRTIARAIDNTQYTMLQDRRMAVFCTLALSEDSLIENLPSLAATPAVGHCDLEPKRLYGDQGSLKRAPLVNGKQQSANREGIAAARSWQGF